MLEMFIKRDQLRKIKIKKMISQRNSRRPSTLVSSNGQKK
jgi:hypothetical protein